jgi:hypothetical protein
MIAELRFSKAAAKMLSFKEIGYVRFPPKADVSATYGEPLAKYYMRALAPPAHHTCRGSSAPHVGEPFAFGDVSGRVPRVSLEALVSSSEAVRGFLLFQADFRCIASQETTNVYRGERTGVHYEQERTGRTNCRHCGSARQQ